MASRDSSGFIDKLFSRWDKLDSKSMQAQLQAFARQRGVLETVFQHLQEGVLVVSSEGCVTYANRTAEALLGFDFSRQRGRPIERFLPDIDWAALSRQEEKAWQKLSSSEVEVFRPEHRILSICAFPLEVEQKSAAEEGTIVLLRDVTREREDAEKAMESERMHAVRMLAASLAHEIGNPLNALGIHLQLLEREVRGIEPKEMQNDFRELVRVAQDEVSRLDLILSRFLRALRPQKPTLEPCNVLEVLEHSLRVMRSDLEEHRIQVAVDHAEALPSIKADAQQLQQVFFNLIKNAVQAMHDGGVLAISVHADDRDLTMSFRDSGGGMDKKAFEHLFQPFHTSKPNGNGIGLTIVQRIVQDHDARIEVASKAGEGTCIRLIFPLAERRARLLSTASRS